MSEPAEPLPQLRTTEQHAGGSLEVPDGVQVLEGSPEGGRRGVAVVVSKFNGEITSKLLASPSGGVTRTVSRWSGRMSAGTSISKVSCPVSPRLAQPWPSTNSSGRRSFSVNRLRIWFASSCRSRPLSTKMHVSRSPMAR